ncbi:MAG: hypothetical protein JSV21_04930 [Nitrospirota bacterium]|nr:MAG: hypothetical protein JSV21_04930 [Nitrospirota bacterium]
MRRSTIILKTFLSVLFILAIMVTASHALIPSLINYQGYLTDATGVPVDRTVSIDFAIYDVSTGGTALWTESHSTVAVVNGVYNVMLGSISTLSLPFDQQYYLGIDVDSDGEMTPRQEMGSVGQAIRADTAELALDVPTGSISASQLQDGATLTEISDNDGTGSGLDADMVDAQHASAFAAASHSHSGADITSGAVADANIASSLARDSEVMGIVTANDGTGSGVDADLLDGQHSAAFASSIHAHSGYDIISGTVADARVDVTITRDNEVMTIVKANDGSGSGVDADTVDGVHASSMNIPSGAVMFFNLSSCPVGWTALTTAQGRYIVGLNPGGTLAQTVGTALNSAENRTVGSHGHGMSSAGSHTHQYRDYMRTYTTDNFHALLDSNWTLATSGSNYSNRYTDPSGSHGHSISGAGSVAGTNAPYIKLLVCVKQ